MGENKHFKEFFYLSDILYQVQNQIKRGYKCILMLLRTATTTKAKQTKMAFKFSGCSKLAGKCKQFKSS